ncbi:MAG: hypothetical protein L6V83_00160 [Christensenella sp.]|nr:MAG: hypothetical protein L6V83_00160 [Christensenella sp.]
MPNSIALTLSGDGARLYPRPTGLSSPVTTALTGYTELSFSSTTAEKSGVPINTIFIFSSCMVNRDFDEDYSSSKVSVHFVV